MSLKPSRKPLLKIVPHTLLGLLFLVSNLVAVAAAAQDVVVGYVDPSITRFSLQPYIEYFEDKSAQLTIQDIYSGKFDGEFISNSELPFTRNHKNGFDPSSVTSNFWLKIYIHPRLNGATANGSNSTVTPSEMPTNPPAESEWYLAAFYPQFYEVELFQSQIEDVNVKSADAKPVETKNLTFTSSISGMHIPFSQRQIDDHDIVFKLPLTAEQTNVIYIRFNKVFYSADLPFYLFTPESYLADKNQRNLLGSTFYGIMIAFLIYNVLLYLSTRRKSYRNYVFYIALVTVATASNDGYGFQLLWSDNSQFEPISIYTFGSIGLYWYIAFIRSFLRLPSLMPLLDRYFQGWMLLCLGALGIIPLCDVRTLFQVFQFLNIGALLSILFASMYTSYCGNRSAHYLLIAEVLFIVGVMVKQLSMGLVVPVNLFTFYCIHIGTVAEVILISLALADRINTMQREKTVYQQQGLEAQRQAMLAAESSNRLKNEFLATISHELRTPMNGVQGALELVKTHKLDEETQSCVDTALESTAQMMLLVDNILSFAEVQSGKIRLHQDPIFLPDVLTDLEKSYKDSCSKKNLYLEFDIQETMEKMVLSDGAKLRELLAILIDNAIKFTPVGGIKVSVRQEFTAEQITQLNAEQQNTITVAFSVRDTGIGISNEARKEIFEPFLQGEGAFNRRYGGLGIGLTMCKQLSLLMGGNIDLNTVEGAGTEFIVTIPFAKPSVVNPSYQAIDSAPMDLSPTLRQSVLAANGLTEQDEGAESFGIAQDYSQDNSQGNDNTSYTVLIVEDNHVNQLVLKKIVEHLGYTVSLVENGKEALDITKKTRFTAILMDCQMPIMDGLEATKKIRAVENLNRHTPIIAVTANGLAEDRENCLTSGMNDYIKKPVTKAIIEEKLHTWVIRRKRLLDEVGQKE